MVSEWLDNWDPRGHKTEFEFYSFEFCYASALSLYRPGQIFRAVRRKEECEAGLVKINHIRAKRLARWYYVAELWNGAKNVNRR